MKKYQNIFGIILSLFGVILVLSLIWLFQSGGQNQDEEFSGAASAGILSAEESVFDFGAISMANGNVSHTFKIKNIGPEPLTITKIYTSCMCTEATLINGDVRKGPFGMPGHGFIPKINQTLAPNEEAQVEVVFDPAAHGPAGLGKTERVVYLENSGRNLKFELFIRANVAP